MKRSSILIVVLSAFGLLVSIRTLAQGPSWWTGSGGWGPGSEYCRMYDTKTVETIKGEVISVEKFSPMKGMSHGIHIMMKTDKETISVHLGPEWYIAAQDTKIERKDLIAVKGSRMTHPFFGEKPFIVASWVKKGEEVLRIRDDSGLPVWQGWRRGLT